MYHSPFTVTNYPRTPQEILDAARDHLLTQNRKSMNGAGCAYRGHKDAACGAGFLIPDALYEPWMEGVSWCEVAVPDSPLGKMYSPHDRLIGHLQTAHDESHDALEEGVTFAESINVSLRWVADEHGLEA